MLKLASSIQNCRILSVHAGGTIGRLGKPVLNPHNLSITAFIVERPNGEGLEALMANDIREFGAQGCVIDHEEEIAHVEELIRLQDLIKLDFQLNGKSVQTESKKRLGKVEDYVININGFTIQKLHVKQPAWKSLTNSSLIVNRTQIVEVSDHHITVRDAVIEQKRAAVAPVPLQ